MEINLLYLIDGAKQAKGTTVIIDVFRAMSVETRLMLNHAEKILPVGDLEIAFNYRKQHPDAVLVGERGGVIVDGFDFGNSPAQIEHVDFTGKTVVHSTSAGTQGISNAIHADEIIAGSLLSAKAIATYIKEKNPETVSIVCMGLAGGKRMPEDDLCGDYIKSLLEGNPIPDIRERAEALKETSGRQFFKPENQKVFPERDFALCVDVDSCPFILRVKTDEETGMACMERVDVPNA